MLAVWTQGPIREHARRKRRGRRRYSLILLRCKVADFLRMSFIEDDEILFPQIRDRLAFLVMNHHADLHLSRGHLDDWLLRRLCSEECRDEDGEKLHFNGRSTDPTTPDD